MLDFADAVMLLKDGGALQGVITLGAGVSLFSLLTVSIALWLRKPVPPAVALLPLGLIAWVAVLAHGAGQVAAFEAIATAAPEMRQRLIAQGIVVQVSALFGAGLHLSLLAGLGSLVAAGPALQQPERRWGRAVPALLVGGLAGGAALASLGMYGTLPVVLLQLGLLVVPVLATAYASTTTERSGTLGAVLAASLLALAVPAGWALHLSSGQYEAFMAIATAAPDLKTTLLLDAMSIVSNLAWLGLVPSVLALALPWLAAARIQEPEDRPGAVLSVGIASSGLLLVVLAMYPTMTSLVVP